MSRMSRVGLALVFVSLLIVSLPAIAGDDWLPIAKEDLAMKDYSPAPGQHAVILYRKVDRNDKEAWEKNYVRIKILDEEGKKYANVETESFSKQYKLDGLQARTIKPDGTVVPFNGKVFDKLVAKYKNYSVYAKSFTLPDVQPGSIIEYRYIFHWDKSEYLFDSSWILSQELPTRDGEFSLTAYSSSSSYANNYRLSWVTFAPPKYQPVNEKGVVTLKVHEFPPLEKEEFTPPLREMQQRVDFTYSEESANSVDEFWNKYAPKWSAGVESFMDRKGAAKNEVAALSSPSDSPEVKLKKLYGRVQKIRNLTYERSKTEKEEKVEKLKDNNNIEDVLKHGYGYHNQLNRTFVALARAAGFPATIIKVSERDEQFPHKEVWTAERFNTEIAVVTVEGVQRYLDPGVPFCPFGLLSWEDTGVMGLMLNKEKAVWGETPQPVSDDSVDRRIANMVLDRDGNLTGEVQLSFEGREALRRRLNAREDDEAERKKDLEKIIKDMAGSGATVELGTIDDWNAATWKFVVNAKVTLPGFAASTGKRVMLPVLIFPGADNHPFTHARRVNPVYFRSPYKEIDEIKIKVPEGLQIESLPQSRTIPGGFGEVVLTAKKDGDSITVVRETIVNGYFFRPEYYPNVRDFFDKVKSVGGEQAVLRAATK